MAGGPAGPLRGRERPRPPRERGPPHLPGAQAQSRDPLHAPSTAAAAALLPGRAAVPAALSSRRARGGRCQREAALIGWRRPSGQGTRPHPGRPESRTWGSGCAQALDSEVSRPRVLCAPPRVGCSARLVGWCSEVPRVGRAGLSPGRTGEDKSGALRARL